MSLSAPLKELALRVPDLISKAGHSEIWGVRLSSPETHVPTQIVLTKYLNANDGDVANRTDVFATVAGLPAIATSAGARERSSMIGDTARLPTAPLVLTPELRRRLSANMVRAMQRRLPGWTMKGVDHLIPE